MLVVFHGCASFAGGFINDMGFDTYMKILNEAVSELKEENWYKDEVGENTEGNDTSVFSRQFVKETIIEIL